MKKYLLLLAGLFAATPALAAGKITYLNVVDDVVYFTTDEAKVSAPACVVAENAQQWTVSLNNKTGRALYSLLVTAMAGKQAINIETGSDCGDISGIERAKGISLQPVNSETSSGSTATAVRNNVLSYGVETSQNFQIISRKNLFTNSSGFYTEEFHGGLGNYKKFSVNNSRRLVASAEGSGWLTAILTPETNGTDTSDKTTLEVIIDGENTTMELSKNGYGSFFFGLTEPSDSDRDKRHIVAPVEVVQQGKGIYFETSLEVWITEAAVAQNAQGFGYAGVHYILGTEVKQ
ncbi:hypothetical protein [Thalassomonas sp. RHCl1]|uniref:hypothetical protein n=1 Tax=Thalassomonas sp. RHCl1 TaxID=2995320 RepID=UPI00248B5860|nr:hypothetical protein [Thalassomonas sp. RHCl1]